MRKRIDIADILNARGLRGFGVEVGVREGMFSVNLLMAWPCRQLVMVDAWTAHLPTYHGDSAGLVAQSTMDRWRRIAAHRAFCFGDRTRIVEMLSAHAAELLDDGYFDFVYLDCNHGYDALGRWGIVQDLRLWWPNLRTGGVFAGHDYFLARCRPNGAPEIVEREEDADTKAYGVKKAVDEFAAEVGAEVLTTTHDEFASWLFIKE